MKRKQTMRKWPWVVVAVLGVVLVGLLLVASGALFVGSDGDVVGPVWTRVNDTTVSLEGPIEQGSFAEFQSVFDDRVSTVILNSGGGDTYDGVQIGRVLHSAGVEIRVRGFCLSSCANYLFTAGQKKIIEDGIVGFHGNTIAAVHLSGGVDQMVTTSIPWYLKLMVDKEELKRRLEATISWEKDFFSDLGISQTLFDQTQLPDKGTGDGKSYDFLLPNAETLANHGITNVLGEQSRNWIQEYGSFARDQGGVASLLVES